MLTKEEKIELRRLHQTLAELYRGKSVDTQQINRLWTRIEMLEMVAEMEYYE